MFNKKQIDFMKKIGISINFDDPSDDEIVTVEDKVSLHLQKHGFDKDNLPTEDCEVCESILDIL